MAAAILDGQFAALPNGMRLHYASAGERGAPLLLFVHGFPEFWYAWQAQLEEFGADHFAVAPDLRGFNLSDQPAEVAAYKARHLVDDLRLLAAHLGYARFTLVAHDWGGAIAWNVAIALPQLLEKLIIINAPHPWLFANALANDARQQQASAYMNWLRADGSEALLAENAYARLESLFHDADGWYTAAVRARYHACWARGLRGGLNLYRAAPLHPPADGNPGAAALKLERGDFRVQVPTRVIWGESDIALPTLLLDGLDDFIDDYALVRIPEGTHWIIHEQPARINALIRGFLAQ